MIVVVVLVVDLVDIVGPIPVPVPVPLRQPLQIGACFAHALFEAALLLARWSAVLLKNRRLLPLLRT